ncbi:MAG: DUF2142 domain-containing protein [Lachnospiraceae bacterium]
MLDRLKKYRKQTTAAYFILCFLYCIVRIAIPVEVTKGEGLEDLGRRQIVERTSYLGEGEYLTFTMPVESDPLTSIGFYLNTDELLLDGILNIEVTNEESGELLGSSAVLLEDITIDQFVTVPTERFTDGTIKVTMYTENSSHSPRFWLNSTVSTDAKTWFGEEESKYPLVYNAGFAVQTRDIRGAVITTLIALLFGVGIYIATEDHKKNVSAKEREFPVGLKSFYERNRLILGGVFVAGLIAAVFFYLYDSRIRIVMNTTERTQVIDTDEPEILLFEDVEDGLVQTYICDAKELTGIGVRMYVPEAAVLTGTLTGSVEDLTDQEVLSEIVFDAADAIDGEYVNFIFKHSVEEAQGHAFEIRLYPSEEIKNSGIGLYVTEEDAYPEHSLVKDGERCDFDLLTQIHEYFNIFLKKYFFFMFAGAEVFAMLFYWMVFIRKCRLETTVLVSLLFLGIFYNFLILPYMAPDEGVHTDMTYRFSNMLLGIDQTSDISIMKRMDDTKCGLSITPKLSSYYEVYHHFFSLAEDTSLVSATATANTYAPFVVYFPAVIGMTIARLLNLGTIPMLMFARWCNLLFFAVCVWWCMKKLPFGKTALAVIALFPMTIQQCNSLSYDAVITSVMFLFSTYIICMTYEEKPIRGSDALILSVLAALLVYGKSGVYLPLCLLALLIPTKKFGGFGRKVISVGSLLGIALLSYINRNSGTVSMVVNTTADTSAVGSAAGNAVAQGYTLGYFLSDPWKLIIMLLNTVTDKIQFYVESIVGQKLGWVDIEISGIIVIAFAVLFFVSMLKVRGEKQYVTGRQKCWIAIVCLMSMGMILMGMLLTWTPFGNVSIEGVQGRYFIPLLPAASLLGRNGTILLSQDKSRGIFCTAMILQLLTVMYLIKALIVVA